MLEAGPEKCDCDWQIGCSEVKMHFTLKLPHICWKHAVLMLSADPFAMVKDCFSFVIKSFRVKKNDRFYGYYQAYFTPAWKCG